MHVLTLQDPNHRSVKQGCTLLLCFNVAGIPASYLCWTSRSTSTTAVLSILFETTFPVSLWPQVTLRDTAAVGLLVPTCGRLSLVPAKLLPSRTCCKLPMPAMLICCQIPPASEHLRLTKRDDLPGNFLFIYFLFANCQLCSCLHAIGTARLCDTASRL